MFDINDFDETLTGPLEWDVKRLAASLEIAGRGNGLEARQRRGVVLAAVAVPRPRCPNSPAMSNLAVWYAQAEVDTCTSRFEARPDGAGPKPRQVHRQGAHARQPAGMGKLTSWSTASRGITADPPLLVPLRELSAADEAAPSRPRCARCSPLSQYPAD